MRRLGLGVLIVVGLMGAAALGWLVGRAQRGEGSIVTTHEAHAPTRYRCPMHPQIVRDQPGHCPICSMNLVPFTPSVSGGAETGTVASSVPGLATITLDDAKRRLIDARTTTVAEGRFVKRLRTVGRVAFDETRMQHVHTKVQGWIEHLHAGAEGDTVRRGEALLTLYSPELLASQQEYLVALDNRARLSGSSIEGVPEDGQRLVDSARRRLLLQDMTEEQIDALERTRRADRIVTLYAPVDGTITARNVSHGERVESATSLLDIADLSTVWILAELYESDLAFVSASQEATITLGALPGRTYRARIQILAPIVNPKTRTITARLEVKNADLALKPGMFADIAFEADLGSRLAVSKDAVIHTGERNVVFVSLEDGAFEPREIALGLELPDRWEVLSGLKAGERVLASANFLVDSESKLRSALAGHGGRR